ncbi:MAG: hypothetical protein Q8J66_00905 [Methylotenera sp.]|nr:hypothetical protein [Methylotenera sp.]
MVRHFDLMVISTTNFFGDSPDYVELDRCTDKQILGGLTRESLRELSVGGRWVTHFDRIGGYVQYFDGRFMCSEI